MEGLVHGQLVLLRFIPVAVAECHGVGTEGRADCTPEVAEKEREKSRVPECLLGARSQVTELPAAAHMLRVLPPLETGE